MSASCLDVLLAQYWMHAGVCRVDRWLFIRIIWTKLIRIHIWQKLPQAISEMYRPTGSFPSNRYHSIHSAAHSSSLDMLVERWWFGREASRHLFTVEHGYCGMEWTRDRHATSLSFRRDDDWLVCYNTHPDSNGEECWEWTRDVIPLDRRLTSVACALGTCRLIVCRRMLSEMSIARKRIGEWC